MHTLRIYSIRYLIISGLALAVSCADISIPPPSPENPTLLVLPANLNNETDETDYQFSYAYEIVSDYDGTAVPTLRVEFVLPVKPGMVIVDSLPPGKYRVQHLFMLPSGPGPKTFGRKATALDLPFSLKAGKITIFDKSLNVRIHNQISGRGDTSVNMMRIYEAKIEYLTRSQRKAIMSWLEKSPNLSAWQFRKFYD